MRDPRYIATQTDACTRAHTRKPECMHESTYLRMAQLSSRKNFHRCRYARCNMHTRNGRPTNHATTDPNMQHQCCMHASMHAVRNMQHATCNMQHALAHCGQAWPFHHWQVLSSPRCITNTMHAPRLFFEKRCGTVL